MDEIQVCAESTTQAATKASRSEQNATTASQFVTINGVIVMENPCVITGRKLPANEITFAGGSYSKIIYVQNRI